MNIPDELWEQAGKLADIRGRSRAAGSWSRNRIIVIAVEEYLNRALHEFLEAEGGATKERKRMPSPPSEDN